METPGIQENSNLKDCLKVLLLHLAAKYDNPSFVLSALLKEVIEELHTEVKEALGEKAHLRLVPTLEQNENSPHPKS
jgi:hypothetical protein